jgi:hypothetical protein
MYKIYHHPSVAVRLRHFLRLTTAVAAFAAAAASSAAGGLAVRRG